MDLLIVEHDGARGDVLRSRWDGLSLVKQAQEGFLIDVEDEEVTLNVVVEGQLPSQFCVLQLQWEQIRMIEFFPNKNSTKIVRFCRINWL